MIIDYVDLHSSIANAELHLHYVNSSMIGYENEDKDIEVYIKTSDLGYHEVYANETVYELADRIGNDIVLVYVNGDEI